MGHPQPPTPMQLDNTFAIVLANGTVKQKRSRAIDMRFYWIQNKSKQGQFIIYWRHENQNLGDYYTKHQSPAHHRQTRPSYLHETEKLTKNLISKLL